MHGTKLQPTAPYWLGLLEFLSSFLYRKRTLPPTPNLFQEVQFVTGFVHFEYEMHRCQFFFCICILYHSLNFLDL